jgi:UDP:flavonoid glycosyltransferase YjiC (YdhE family)
MRVLFTTWAWPSHYFPMVPLAWAFRAAGHDVRVASQPELAATMLGSGLPSVVVGRDVDLAAHHRRATEHLRAGRPPATSPAGPARRQPEFIEVARAVQATRPKDRPKLSLYGEVADAMADDLVALARRWRPDLVVFDALTFAGPLAARVIGVPAVRHLFGPDVSYFTLGLETDLLRPVLKRFGLDELSLLGALSVDPCPPSLQFRDDVAPVARAAMRFVPYHGLSEVPRWVWQTPDRPRICLTWGTSTARLVGEHAFLPAPLVQSCAKLAAERGMELVLAITAAQRRLLPELPEGVRVAESVPLQALLTTCRAIVHQGGAGGMLTAALCGLPQLVVPQLPDQVLNANHLAATGAALAVHIDEADVPTVYAAGKRLFEEPSFAESARRLRGEILDLPGPTDLVDELTALARGERPAPPQHAPVWTGDMLRMPFDDYLETLRGAQRSV